MARWPLAAILATACGSPPAPAPPEVRPAPPLANECAPVPRIAHAPFYFADLESGASCTVFLEQDECVVAIFDDCTDPTRHFEGRVTSEGGVWLAPEYTQPPTSTPPSRCEGVVGERAGARPFVNLACRGTARHRGLFLEKVDPSATPVATIVDTVELPGPAIELVGGGRALVAAGSASGLYGPNGSIVVAFDPPLVAREGRDGSIAVATATEILLIRDGAIARRASLDAAALALDFSAAGDRLYVAVAGGNASTLRSLSTSDLAPIASPVELPGRAEGVVAFPAASPAVLAVMFSKGGGAFSDPSELWTIDASARVVERVLLDFRVARPVAISERRVGLVAYGRNAYVEVDVVDGTISMGPVPYFGQARSLAVDASGARAWIGGASSVARLEVPTLRSAQAPLVVPGAIHAIRDEGQTLWIAAGSSLFRAAP
ncbi:MAG: hypothetical protein HYV07_09980 [Deltaproteobacteria bacterium]|nr:hypothetical protein [Deltaproteobacteria bacterium]